MKNFIKRGLLVLGAGVIIGAPASVAAHGNWGNRGDDDGRRDGFSRRGDGDEDRSNDRRHWSKPWHRREDKPRPPIDPAVCAEWQTRLNDWVTNFKNTASKDIQFGSDYHVMVQTFVTNQELTVENYDNQNANVTAKQTAATAAVDALEAPDLNCENDAAETTERGIDRSAFRDTKRALENYKQSLKELTEAVRASYGGNGMMM